MYLHKHCFLFKIYIMSLLTKGRIFCVEAKCYMSCSHSTLHLTLQQLYFHCHKLVLPL